MIKYISAGNTDRCVSSSFDISLHQFHATLFSTSSDHHGPSSHHSIFCLITCRANRNVVSSSACVCVCGVLMRPPAHRTASLATAGTVPATVCRHTQFLTAILITRLCSALQIAFVCELDKGQGSRRQGRSLRELDPT